LHCLAKMVKDRSCGLAHLYQATFSAEQCLPMLYF
jgi:hypothetical protein